MDKFLTLERPFTLEEQKIIAQSKNYNKIIELLYSDNLTIEAVDILVDRYVAKRLPNKFNKTLSKHFKVLIDSSSFQEKHMQAFLMASLKKPIYVDGVKTSAALIKHQPEFIKFFPSAFAEATQHRLKYKSFWRETHCADHLNKLIPTNVWVDTYSATFNIERRHEYYSAHTYVADVILTAYALDPKNHRETITWILNNELSHYKQEAHETQSSLVIKKARKLLNISTNLKISITDPSNSFKISINSPQKEKLIEVQETEEVMFEETDPVILQKIEDRKKEFKVVSKRFKASRTIADNFMRNIGSDFPEEIQTKIKKAESNTYKTLKFYESNLEVTPSAQSDKALQVASLKALDAIESFERAVDFIIEAAEIESEEELNLRDSFDDAIISTRTWSEMKKMDIN